MRGFIFIAVLSSAVLALEPVKIDMHGKEPAMQKKAALSYGKVLEIYPAMGYKYLKVDQNGTERWVAVADAPVEVGMTIGFDTKTVMQNFKSKALNRSFKEIVFANELYLPKKQKRVKSLKSMLGINTSIDANRDAPVEQTPAKPFVKKELYTVEEVHMWRKWLKDKAVKVKGKVYKVARGIMKRDWVHIGDGTGSEQKLTDDLVFTMAHAPVKAGDEVIAEGTLKVDKDFGYGYFYDAIVENAMIRPAR